MGIVGNLLSKATRKEGERLNIITASAHERYETSLSKANANFFSLNFQGVKGWSEHYAKIPNNYTIFKDHNLPPYFDYHAVLCHNKAQHFGVLKQVAIHNHLPLINLEHCLPPLGATPQQIFSYKNGMVADINIFISEFSRDAWGYSKEESEVVHHGVDTELFKNQNKPRDNVILTVGNDMANRSELLGFDIFQRVCQGLPTRIVGDNRGISLPAKNEFDLINTYNAASIYFCPAKWSPVSFSLLESMACGCAVLAKPNPLISTFIVNGENGFCTDNEGEMRKYLELLLKDPPLARKLGNAARKTVQEKFGLQRFVNEWNNILLRTSNMFYKGD